MSDGLRTTPLTLGVRSLGGKSFSFCLCLVSILLQAVRVLSEQIKHHHTRFLFKPPATLSSLFSHDFFRAFPRKYGAQNRPQGPVFIERERPVIALADQLQEIGQGDATCPHVLFRPKPLRTAPITAQLHPWQFPHEKAPPGLCLTAWFGQDCSWTHSPKRSVGTAR